MLKNMFRHFFVATGALGYLLAVPVLLWQYLGLMNDWPHLFLSVVHEPTGDWWINWDWSAPSLWISMAAIISCAAAYAVWKRDDYEEYREPSVQSQPGF